MEHLYQANNIHCTTVHSSTLYCCHHKTAQHPAPRAETATPRARANQHVARGADFARGAEPHFTRFTARRRSLREYLCFSSSTTSPVIRRRLCSTPPEKTGKERGERQRVRSREDAVKSRYKSRDVISVKSRDKNRLSAPELISVKCVEMCDERSFLADLPALASVPMSVAVPNSITVPNSAPPCSRSVPNSVPPYSEWVAYNMGELVPVQQPLINVSEPVLSVNSTPTRGEKCDDHTLRMSALYCSNEQSSKHLV